MLTRERIIYLFERLNDALKEEGEIGEIGIVGGATMCLVYHARGATRDVDAVFAPASVLRRLAARLGEEEGIAPDWLNDAVKGFLVPNFLQQEVLSLSHLRVWAPEGRYMLAMKCMSARWDSSDKEDVIFLLRHLRIESAQEVISLLEHYYPDNLIPAKTRFFIEEICSRDRKP